MTLIINKIVCIFISFVCFVSGVFGVVDAEKIEAKQYEILGSGSCDAGYGRVGVHDPSVVQDEDGTYYVFGSHLTVAKSDDLISWSNVACGVNDSNRLIVSQESTLRQTLSEPLAWTDAFQQLNSYSESDWQTNVWAADVIYNKAMGKYCYYASSSVWGTAHSVIWFATSDNIEGPYEYQKAVVYSGFDNKTVDNKYSRATSLHYSFTNISSLINSGDLYIKDVLNNDWCDINGNYDSTRYPNAIDPNVFYDEEGQLWMVYGSYFAGIFIMPMDEETGMPDYEYMRKTDGYDMYFGKQVLKTTFDNELSGEGPYIIYDSQSDYYYLYISYCGLNSLGGYNIREYRSKNVDGPYLDAAGNSALDYTNTGVKLFGNYKFDCLDTAYLAGGHSSSLITKDNKMFQVYHTRFNNFTEGFQTRVHQMARTKSGWAVVLPFEYQGETIDYSGISKETIIGEYEFINHGSISNGCTDWANAENIISPTQSVTLNADGTITGLKVYESTKDNTAVSSKDVSGTWQVEDGTAYITFVIDGVMYDGVYCLQNDESAEKTEKVVFSAIGSNNECIWGVKK